MAKPKTSTVLWSLITLVLIVGICVLAVQLVTANENLLFTKKELEAVQIESEELQGQLEALAEEKDELEVRISIMDEEVGKLNVDLDTTRKENIRLASALDINTREIDGLKTSLMTERGEKDALALELQKVKQEQKDTQELLDQVRSAKQALESRFTRQMPAEEVELEKIVVQPKEVTKKVVVVKEEAVEEVVVLEKVLEGKVLVVNRDYNFIVINLGQNDGVEVGTVFDVYKSERSRRPIGQVRVEKIYQTMSAATIVSEKRKKITKGSFVKSI